jgi:hypothetical protein
MKNNIVKIVLGVIILLILLFLIFKSKREERVFNKVELSNLSTIDNVVFPTYYDTVLSVAMKEMGVGGYVIVEQISDVAKSNFDGELKAHIRYFNSKFYLFTGKMSRDESIEVLCHEVVHMQQYVSGDLVYDNNFIIWKGNKMELNSKEYMDRPWEKDAFDRQSQLIRSVESVLYLNK